MYKKIIGCLAVLLLIVSASLPALAIATTTPTITQKNGQNLYSSQNVNRPLKIVAFLKYLIAHRYSIIVSRGTQTGTLGIDLMSTDVKPTDFILNDLTITISMIQVRHVSTIGPARDAEWITMVNSPQTLDLIKSQSQEIPLTQRAVEMGQFDEVQFTIESATAIIDGHLFTLPVTTHDVLVPTLFYLKQGQMVTLGFEFDVAGSLHHTALHEFSMNPVIKFTGLIK